MLDLKTAIARFGADAKAKLSNPSATGEPEDQLRAPLENLFADLTELCGFKRDWVAAVGESSLSTLHTRPDYAITLRNVLVGFVEVKAPGKGADPRRYQGHDKEQWEKLQSVPRLLHTDSVKGDAGCRAALQEQACIANIRSYSIDSPNSLSSLRPWHLHSRQNGSESLVSS